MIQIPKFKVSSGTHDIWAWVSNSRMIFGDVKWASAAFSIMETKRVLPS